LIAKAETVLSLYGRMGHRFLQARTKKRISFNHRLGRHVQREMEALDDIEESWGRQSIRSEAKAPVEPLDPACTSSPTWTLSAWGPGQTRPELGIWFGGSGPDGESVGMRLAATVLYSSANCGRSTQARSILAH
jgi:hypothetical protein